MYVKGNIATEDTLWQYFVIPLIHLQLSFKTDRVLNCLSLTYMFANDEIMVLYYSSFLYCKKSKNVISTVLFQNGQECFYILHNFIILKATNFTKFEH